MIRRTLQSCTPKSLTVCRQPYFRKTASRSIFSLASSICSGAPLNFICVPRLKIFKRGNFFLRMSSLPLLTPKNSIGFTVSRLMIVSVNADQFLILFFSFKKKQAWVNKNCWLYLICYLLPILLYKRLQYEFNYTHWLFIRGKVKKGWY